MTESPSTIIKFWFEEIKPANWFTKSEAFDQQIRARFMETYEFVKSEKSKAWRETAEGRLAEIIVLDQFPRNMFRDSPQSFATDALALRLSKEAVEKGEDKKLSTTQRSFLYMPYMHSEDISAHDEAIKLFALPGLEGNLKFERKHRDIIVKFGRYPHRNQILGRTSTPEEIAFLKTEGSSF